MDIAHPTWWTNGDGLAPAPFTVITANDLAHGLWRARNPLLQLAALRGRFMELLTERLQPDIKRLRVEGHTDNKGSDMYNLDLSHRRAQSVMVYLVGKGVETWRLTSAGFGFRCPLVPNDSADHRAENRRVDFIIIEQEGQKLDAPKCQLSLLPNR